MCRALISLAYWEKGQYNSGPKAAYILALKAKTITDDAARQDFIADAIVEKATSSKKRGTSCRKSIVAFACAFVYEPANGYGEDLVYIHNPQKLYHIIYKIIIQ